MSHHPKPMFKRCMEQEPSRLSTKPLCQKGVVFETGIEQGPYQDYSNHGQDHKTCIIPETYAAQGALTAGIDIESFAAMQKSLRPKKTGSPSPGARPWP